MKNKAYCKKLAKYMQWKWLGCSLDSEIEGRSSGMFQMGYNTFTLPMSIVRLACAGIKSKKRPFWLV